MHILIPLLVVSAIFDCGVGPLRWSSSFNSFIVDISNPPSGLLLSQI